MQKNIIKLSLISLIIFIIGVFFIGLKKSSIYDTKDLVGQKITKIQLDHFSENRIITGEDLKKNNFTLINFWASWCSPCRVEHPILMSLSKSKKLKLVGINFKDKKDNAKKFLKELGNPYNLVAKDEIGKKSVNFGIYGIPESILVNKEMIVIKKFIGPLNTQDYNEILKIIN